ncbi:2-oxoacid:acceptor oxidoreductase subunit alpha [Natranaerobius thermophilus]|uniref:2-oxoglutarate ferredoxin oxidoreductase, alpha subunit n=1 Tax=Natranaerobius thermophilus (strain ATCC BAA-1301 / DSM 18059 / JW/NM-WN-LF) TaxID=457570 RepID=B2A3W3_NATTJ|nr:2-oxoacid:acceptor oxidoreductase subunit alpha [Natranaerobius thermophilus]ACB85065.1 2-oxoglutarate ferredoxin oxidoreductase, alpha subunit [Natranaerobius thermophilus JW/NM-WN-LF]
MKNNQAVLMQGNEACVKGALRAGATFYAGYPITPSSEVAEGFAEELPKIGGKFIQMEDEIGSMAAIVGASLTGAKSVTATSGPGFSLKQENLGYACMAEVPCVVINVQRSGPSTGGPTAPSQGDVMQAKWGTHGDHPTIALAPSSVRETFDMTIKAFNLAEKFRTPVILLLDEVVGHLRENVVLPPEDEIELINRKKSDNKSDYMPFDAESDGIPPMENFGEGSLYHVTGLHHDKTGFPNLNTQVVDSLVRRLVNKVEQNADEIIDIEIDVPENANTVLVSYGSVARSTKSACKELRAKGNQVGHIRLQTIWPFPYDQLKEQLQGVERVIVPEMNMGQIVGEVEKCVGTDQQVEGVNRVDTHLITPQEIISTVEREEG